VIWLALPFVFILGFLIGFRVGDRDRGPWVGIIKDPTL